MRSDCLPDKKFKPTSGAPDMSWFRQPTPGYGPHKLQEQQPVSRSRLLVLLLITVTASPPSLSYDAYVGPHTPTVTGPFLSISYDYSVSGAATPALDATACHSSTCWFAPMPRTGLGPGAGGLCDSGGICYGASLRDGVTIPGGTTWNNAFALFLKTYPASGTFTLGNWLRNDMGMYVRWDAICVGFASIPATGTHISVLAPGTACGSVPRPDLNCTVDVPSVLDLGTVRVGTVSASGTVRGSVLCDREASVTASLLSHPLLDGQEVEIDINGFTIGNSAVTIGTGTSVPLRVTATIRGTLRHPGSYSSAALLQISYH